MDSSEEDSCDLITTKELNNKTTTTTQDILPQTKERYDKRYAKFKEWQASRKYTVISQPVLMAYFFELAEKQKPTSLWATLSMLKVRMKTNDNIDIGSFGELTAFIKSKSEGYSPVRASVFSLEDIHKFIDMASDLHWLDVKVVCIFGVTGGCGSNELPRIKLKDVQNNGDVVTVRIAATVTTKTERSFTITGKFRHVVQRYMALRVPNISQDRFFINYQRGKCTNQAIGKNKFYNMPRRIAKFLELPDPDSYTGNSFRRTSRSFRENAACTIFTNGIESGGGTTSKSFIGDTTQNRIPTASTISAIPPAQFAGNMSTYNSSNTFNNTLHSGHDPNTIFDPRITTNYTNQPNKKFGEIFCSPMGVLSYHCALCPAQMEHNDEFCLHYMSHFRDVFQHKEVSKGSSMILGPHYGITEQFQPISTIKLELEEPQIKAEPMDSDGVGSYPF